MKSHLQDAERNIVGEQAAKWLSELPGSSDEHRAAFVAWLKQSPRHVEEFLFASATCKAFARDRNLAGDAASASTSLGAAQDSEIERIVAEALTRRPDNVVAWGKAASLPEGSEHASRASNDDPPMPEVAIRSTRSKRAKVFLRIAAAVAAITISALWGPSLIPMLRSNSVSTSIGEQRTVRLSDGSVVYLNARSRISIDYSSASRDIELDEGEAVFKVEHDPARPFRVHTSDAVVQAVGTQFNVYRRPAGTTVSVLEGKVEIRPADVAMPSMGISSGHIPSVAQSVTETAVLIAAGEQASVESAGKILKQTAPDVAAAVAWRERRLVFSADRLEDIASEFARYSPHHIRLQDDAAREKRITGTFDADDPESLVLFLEDLDELRVERNEDDFVVRGR